MPAELDIPPEVIASFITFGREQLGLPMHEWQEDVVEEFDHASNRLVLVSLATPNGSGKSSVVIPVLALGWLWLYPQGRVVITTADGKQLDGQVMPALERYRGKFAHWKFIERQVTTPSGGQLIAFTTDDPGRAEGWHKLDDEKGPLLIICDEAKTIPDAIFSAIDRCTPNAILLTSSPGHKVGRFYDSQFRPELRFRRFQIGLKDCPHIPKSKIDRIIDTHGADSPFTRSTLHGEFMDAESEQRFDRDGLEYLSAQVESERQQPRAVLGRILEQPRPHGAAFQQWVKDKAGYFWVSELPVPGCSYIGFCDPMTGEQSEGSLERDTHSAGILRAPFMDPDGVIYDAEVVAMCHAPGGCRWYNDVLAERFGSLLRFYGDPMAIVEANNSGTEVMRLLSQAGRTLWRREKPNHRVPGRKMLEVVGFHTTALTKSLWVGALSSAISERSLVCKYGQAVEHFKNFIIEESGRGAAQPGTFDDHVTGIGLGLFAIGGAAKLRTPKIKPRVWWRGRAEAKFTGAPWS